MADARLEEVALRLEAVTQAIGDALITTDLHSVVTSWNRGAERLYGYMSAEAVGQSILMIVLPERVAEEREILNRIQCGESIREVSTLHTHQDGRYVTVSLIVSPIDGVDGKPIGTVRIARDLSQRQRGEHAVRRLAAIVESSDDAILSKDLNGIVTSWNRAAQRVFGYSAAEMVGQSIRRLIPADRQAEEDHVLACIRRGEKVEHFDTIRRRKDGATVPISLTVSPILDENGTVIGASKIARDISDRQRLEADRARVLAAAEENAAITEKLNRVGTVVASALDRDMVVQEVTAAATQLAAAQFGAFLDNVSDDRGEPSRLHPISGAPREAFATFPMPRDTELFELTFRGDGPVRSDDITQDARCGRIPPYHGMSPDDVPVRSYLAVPVKARSGEVLGGLFFGHSQIGRFTDRHERIVGGIASWAAIALENARLYVSVQEASQLKDEFLATLSHELRTPLNAILGYARMIRAGMVTPDKRQRALETIERNATSLTQIVEDVLDVSRIISGKMRLNVQPVDLPDVVRYAVEAVVPAAEAKGVHIDTIVDPRAPSISGDPERLQQVVWNLMSNAVKFTGRGGHVHVRLERVDSHVEVVVSDTGIGIPPAFLPHVFERFRQADAGTTRERGGLGLGLGIARQLVEMHGGTIQAVSAGEGKGATFQVKLPVMIVQPQALVGTVGHTTTPIVGSQALLPDLRGVRVLAVDDEGDALNMVREILEAAGADVTIAASAAQTLNILTSLRPDVLVSDLGMPRMDGFELIREVRRNSDHMIRNIPAAALTAYARSEDRVKALRSGFQIHLSKPIDPAELIAAIASLALRTAVNHGR